MKQKLSAYASIKSALANVERKQSGSLAVRNLNGVLRPEDFIQNSEYLRTVLVAVPTYFALTMFVCCQVADLVVARQMRPLSPRMKH